MDNKKKLEAAGTSLLDLVKTHARSTKKRFLRGVFEQVEESLKQGVPTKIIVESLRKNGLDITDGYFTSAMSQIRKEKGTARISKPKIGNPSSSTENAPPANSTEPDTKAEKKEPDTKVEKTELGAGGENPMETNQGGTGSKKPKIRTRKDLRNAKKSGNEETDQFIN